ncbi:MAG: transcriptional repressor [Candidatus Obscuribacterales bacterium]|jgi:Fur family ferric uptake transcriptional regulator
MDETKNKLLSTQEAIEAIVKAIPRGDHLTAPEVYELAIERGLKVSLSTVYRTLNKLKADGNVITVSGDRGQRYESVEEGPAHDHLICLACGTTIEFYDELIRGFGKAMAQRKGFDHTASRFDILGYCQNCRSKDANHKIDLVQDGVSTAIEHGEEALGQMRLGLEQLRMRKFAKALSPLRSAIAQLKQTIEELEYSANSLGGDSNGHP